MTYEERQQIIYLKNRKDTLLYQFIGACEEINKQIDEVRNGEWKKQTEGNNVKNQKNS